jgi:hypothetical protein
MTHLLPRVGRLQFDRRLPGTEGALNHGLRMVVRQLGARVYHRVACPLAEHPPLAGHLPDDGERQPVDTCAGADVTPPFRLGSKKTYIAFPPLRGALSLQLISKDMLLAK